MHPRRTEREQQPAAAASAGGLCHRVSQSANRAPLKMVPTASRDMSLGPTAGVPVAGLSASRRYAPAMGRHHFSRGARVLAAAVLWALVAPRPAAGGEVDDLIAQLTATSRSRRETADRILRSLGPDTLPDLAAAIPTATGEAAFRLRSIRSALVNEAVLAAVEPTSLSLTAENEPLSELLARIGAEAGRLPLVGAGGDPTASDRRVSLHLDRATYWEAIDAVTKAAGCRLSYREMRDEAAGCGLVVAPLGKGQQPAASAAAGLFRVEVAGVSGFASSAAGGFRGLRLPLRVAWEPRINPLVLQLPLRSIVAEGPAGEAVAVRRRTAVLEATHLRGRCWSEFAITLTQPDTPLESLGMLRGTLDCVLAAAPCCFTFRVEPGSPLPSTQTLGALKVSLEAVDRSPGRLAATLRAEYADESEALASHRAWITRQLPVAGCGGRPLPRLTADVVRRSRRGITLQVVFRLPSEPAENAACEINWRLPVAILDVPVDFAIRGIPLPREAGPAENFE